VSERERVCERRRERARRGERGLASLVILVSLVARIERAADVLLRTQTLAPALAAALCSQPLCASSSSMRRSRPSGPSCPCTSTTPTARMPCLARTYTSHSLCVGRDHRWQIRSIFLLLQKSVAWRVCILYGILFGILYGILCGILYGILCGILYGILYGIFTL
jgi:hypothetical protein